MQLSILIEELETIKNEEGDMQVFIMPELTDEDYDVKLVSFDKEHFCTQIEVVRA